MMMLMMLLFLAAGLSFLILFAGSILTKKNFFDREMLSPFECGFSTFKESRVPFSLRFFVLALIFVIFDVEIIIMMPFILSIYSCSHFMSIILYLAFLLILTVGLLNEWNQNMLEWIK